MNLVLELEGTLSIIPVTKKKKKKKDTLAQLYHASNMLTEGTIFTCLMYRRTKT